MTLSVGGEFTPAAQLSGLIVCFNFNCFNFRAVIVAEYCSTVTVLSVLCSTVSTKCIVQYCQY